MNQDNASANVGAVIGIAIGILYTLALSFFDGTTIEWLPEIKSVVQRTWRSRNV